MILGSNHSIDTKKIISIKTKEAMKNSLIREKISKRLKGKKRGPLSEETKRKLSECQKGEKGYWFSKKMSLKTRKKMSKARKGTHPSLETRKKLSELRKGKKSLLIGRKISEEHKRKISEKRKIKFKEQGFLNTEKTKKKISKSLKEYYKTHPGTMTGVVSPSKGKKLSTKQILHLSKLAKLRWKDKTYLKKIHKGMHINPNKPEKILMNLFKKCKFDYRFVGDFSFIIEGKNPDFVNCNGQKKIIELFGDYWHNNSKTKYHQTELGTKEHYAKYGWKTLVIWEKELKDMDSVLEKVTRFDKL